jgi:hypothetical protein
MHTGGGGEGVRSEKLSHKNAIKREKGKKGKKGTPLDFLTTPSTPLKRICLKIQGPTPLPRFPTTVHLRRQFSKENENKQEKSFLTHSSKF